MISLPCCFGPETTCGRETVDLMASVKQKEGAGNAISPQKHASSLTSFSSAASSFQYSHGWQPSLQNTNPWETFKIQSITDNPVG